MPNSPKPSKRSTRKESNEVSTNVNEAFDEYTPLARIVVTDLSQNFGVDERLEPEFRFHPDRLWRADLAMVRSQIMIEFEGGVWTHNRGERKSRHMTGIGFEEDCRKYNAAGELGWIVLRFTPEMVTRGEAGSVIAAAWRMRNKYDAYTQKN